MLTESRGALDTGAIVVVAGFQGISTDGDITTLGRGGSDTTAVALACGIGADVCEIYSDVEGIYTADPRVALVLRSSTVSHMMICLSFPVAALVFCSRALWNSLVNIML